MKTCLLYGNCQSDALKIYLKNIAKFCQQYKILDLPAVHLLNQSHVKQLQKHCKKLDLLIHQPISDNYKNTPELSTNYIKSIIPSSCKVISFPVCYFNGYNPELISFKSLNGQPVNAFTSYINSNIIKNYAQGTSIQESLDSYNNPDYIPKVKVDKWKNEALARLALRENNLDIIITPYIKENYKKVKLFHTYNHPNSQLLLFLCKEILKNLPGFSETDLLALPQRLHKRELLGQNRFPTYASISHHLKLKYSPLDKITLKKQEITKREYLQLHYDFLDTNSSLVEFNVNYYNL